MYIVFEGIDGAGKTTLINQLKEKLNCETIQEPTDRFDKEKIHKKDTYLKVRYYAMDRNHNKDLIRKCLLENKIILSDRSIYSSLAYQGLNLNPNIIYGLNSDCIIPQHVIYLDIPVEIAKERDKTVDVEYLSKVKNEYKKYYDKFTVFNALDKDLFDKVYNHILKLHTIFNVKK